MLKIVTWFFFLHFRSVEGGQWAVGRGPWYDVPTTHVPHILSSGLPAYTSNRTLHQ